MNKKLTLLFICLLCFILFMAGSNATGAEKPKEDEVKLDTKNYQEAGLVIDNTFIKAGESLTTLWGVMGPPDKLNVMRGKDSADSDYVKVAYYSYGVSFDIDNHKNLIKGILVQTNERGVTLKNCPFKVGQSVQDVVKFWGEPEKKMDDLYAYWRRGVYIGTASGTVKYIYIASRGTFDDEKAGGEQK